MIAEDYMPAAPAIKRARGGSWPHWTTPDVVLQRVRQVNRIQMDPCGNPESKVRPACAWHGGDDAESDGLQADWRYHGQGGLVFCNPPYSSNELRLWVAKCVEQALPGGPPAKLPGAEIVLLVPASTGTRWFARIRETAQALCLWGPGRIAFDNPPPGTEPGSPSIDNLLAYWGPRPHRFLDAFHGAGLGVRL